MNIFDDPIFGEIMENSTSEIITDEVNKSLLYIDVRDSLDAILSAHDSWSWQEVACYWRMWQWINGWTLIDNERDVCAEYARLKVEAGTDASPDLLLRELIKARAAELSLVAKAHEVRCDWDSDEYKFIEEHRDELTQWCPIKLDEVKNRWNEARANERSRSQDYLFFIYHIVSNIGHYPHSWKALSALSLNVTEANAVELMRTLTDKDRKIKDDFIVDGALNSPFDIVSLINWYDGIDDYYRSISDNQ